MYCQLEVDYYSNEANKTKYKNFQLIASTKNNLKIAEEQIVQGIVLANNNLPYFVAWLVVASKYVLQVQVMFVWARYK